MAVEYRRASVPSHTAERLLFGRQPVTGHATLDLIDHARSCLAEATLARVSNDRFVAAHLAALRAAAAVLAARARPVDPRRRGRRTRRGHGPRNVWQLLPAIAPELAEWASFFAAKSGRRAAAQAGLVGAVSEREADDLVREAERFLGDVGRLLGLSGLVPSDRSVAAPGPAL